MATMADLENPSASEYVPPTKNLPSKHAARIREAAAMLAIFSIFASVEGIVRTVTPANRDPEVPLTARPSLARLPDAVLLAGGVAEVIFGLAGLYLAFLTFLAPTTRTRWLSTTVTLPFLILQGVLGWFVFIIYVLAEPLALAIHLPAGREAALGLSPAADRANIILGFLLASINFCWALQGGQFTMALRLYKAQRESTDPSSTPSDTPKSNATRAYIWSGNFIVAAFSTIFVGAVLIANDFPNRGAMDFAPYPPHVVWYPALSVVTGLVMLAWGVGAVVGVRKAGVKGVVMGTWPTVATLMVVNFALVFGKFAGFGPPIAGAAQHFGLVMAVTILPVYFAHRAHHDVE